MKIIFHAMAVEPGARLFHGVAVVDAVDGDGHVAILARVRRPSYTQRPMCKMPMAVHAVDEDEVADGPADRTERLFCDGTVVKEQRDMRREIATPQMSQAIPSRECRGERP